MVTRTASLRLQLIDSVSGPSKGVAGSLSAIDKALSRFGKGGTPEMRRLVKELEYLQKKAGAIEDFASSRKGLKQLSTEMKAAQSNVTRLSAAVANAAKPSAALKRELAGAQRSLEQAKGAFLQYGQAARTAEGALRSFGISGPKNISQTQQQIRSELAKTVREMRRLDQEARRAKQPAQPRQPAGPPSPRQPPPGQRPPGAGSPVFDAAVAAGGTYAAGKAKSIAETSFFGAVDFNREAAYQAALGGFSPEERAQLNKQAEQIGGDTRFSNPDVVRAQTTILQRGIRDPKVIMDLTKKVTDYALAMGVTLEEASETVTGSALSKRVDLKDTTAISKFVDFMVWMAKNGGMSSEDVSQFIKYGGSPTTGAGLPDPYMAAMGMILRRSGVRGDEAGVFARSAASKLVAPTQKGRNALLAMGIDYNKFTSIDSMNSEGIGMLLKNNFGKRITPEMRGKIQDLIDNGEFTDPDTGETKSVISDNGEFVTQMSDILAPLFAGKNGKMSAKDAKDLAIDLSNYQKNSIESVDVVGLLNAIAGQNPSLPQLNAFFTDKQGGRANMIFQQWPLFMELLNKMQNVPTGVAQDIGTKANSELYGDWTKMVGTFETVTTRIGQDFEGVTRPIINSLNSVGDGFLSLDQSTRQVVAAFGFAAAALAGFAAARAGGNLLASVLKGGGAAAEGAATGGGILSTLIKGGGGWLGRLGMLGNAYTAWQVGSAAGQGVAKVGEIAGGKYWMPKDADEAGDMRSQRDELMAKINQIRSVSKIPEAAEIAIKPLQDQVDQLNLRIQAFDQLNVKPTIDATSIDEAQGKATTLRATLSGLGIATGGTPAAAPAAAPPTPVAGARAAGGPVQSGKTYLVGEEGPELFTPGRSGGITPNGAMGGVSIVFHNVFNGDGQGGMRQFAAELNRQMNRSAQTAFGVVRPYDGG